MKIRSFSMQSSNSVRQLSVVGGFSRLDTFCRDIR